MVVMKKHHFFFPYIWILISALFFTSFSCPSAGKEIIIENQTDNFVFVIDSLTGPGSLKIYDTFSVNNRKYIGSRPNCIPRFDKWQNFLSREDVRVLEEKGVSEFKFYFIIKDNINKPIKEISHYRLYDSIQINLREIKTIN